MRCDKKRAELIRKTNIAIAIDICMGSFSVEGKAGMASSLPSRLSISIPLNDGLSNCYFASPPSFLPSLLTCGVANDA